MKKNKYNWIDYESIQNSESQIIRESNNEKDNININEIIKSINDINIDSEELGDNNYFYKKIIIKKWGKKKKFLDN